MTSPSGSRRFCQRGRRIALIVDAGPLYAYIDADDRHRTTSRNCRRTSTTSRSCLNSLISPWHQFLDPVRYNRHVDTVEALKPRVIASAHGPILVGDAIHDAFDRVRTLAGKPIIAPPGQDALDAILAGIIEQPAA